MSEEIRVLNDFQHARLRAEMYLGSRVPHKFRFPIFADGVFRVQEVEFVPAILTAFREALDNALDEMSFLPPKHLREIRVSYDEERFFFEVCDSGRGIPITWREDEGMHTATLAVSMMKAGRNFGDRGEQAGTNGLGISVVNFVSSIFKLEVWRDGKNFTQSFAPGEEDVERSDPLIEDSGTQTGTCISFELDPKVFDYLVMPSSVIESLVVLVASVNPSIKFFFNNEEVRVYKDVKSSVFGPLQHVMEFPFEFGTYYVTETLDEAFTMSLVNNVPAYNGGTHDTEFTYHFPRRLIEALEKESKKRKLRPNKNDVMDGLFIFGNIRMKAPNFDSQSKTRLINEEIKKPIAKMLMEDFDWQAFIKKNSVFIENVYARCAARTHKIDMSDVDREAKKLKKAKIAKLLDATSRNRSECVLFLTEGDSAAGGINEVRNPAIHGVMPLRGKVLNVFHKNPKQALASKVIQDICGAIGLVPGKKAVVSELRFSKVFIMTDADEDGQGSICPLLLLLFYRFWPELFEQEESFVQVFMTPLIILEKGKESRYFYPNNIDEFDFNAWKGWKVVRAKGLGSLQPNNFKDQLENPIVIPMKKDFLLSHVLDLLFNGNRADDRKVMISSKVDELVSLIQESGSNWETFQLDV